VEIVEPSARIIPNVVDDTQNNALKFIELNGRVAYKSEDKITETSAVKFVRGIIESGHESVLEHFTHRFAVKVNSDTIEVDLAEIMNSTVGFHYSSVTDGYVVSANVRSIRDAKRFANNDLTDALFKEVRVRFPDLYEDLGVSLLPESYYDVRLITESEVYQSMPTWEAFRHMYRTVKFICDRGISHEIVRHRLCAFTQESTRYCNYSKKGMTFIMPPWGLTEDDRDFLYDIEYQYNRKTDTFRHKPQQSRYWTNAGLKTEINMTTNLIEWLHFFKLRTDKTAHPQMRQLTVPLFKDFQVKLGQDFGSYITPVPCEYK
jgi:thymidylate synthase (FAD)